MKYPFKISTRLKDLIGRDLITDEFVAVFELVKNSFDARATLIRILFECDRIVITDNGKGMSERDILNKWLFVAYSAKRERTEDSDYRDQVVVRRRPYAGDKGVGRFSCDRLGTCLHLSSRAQGQPVQIVDIDWTRYEQDSQEEFGEIKIDVEQAPHFPDPECEPVGETGTVLDIRSLRSGWDREKLQKLKRELMKLIDPFADGSTNFEIVIAAPDELEVDKNDAEYNNSRPENKEPLLLVNGKVENPVLQILGQRTTTIRVRLTDDGKILESVLNDRGDLIYHIKEPNPYERLKSSGFGGDIFFLNRSAKAVFARRMGIPSVQFGSIFLFRNGFRIFPIGHETDDFFGLARRKQQGERRFLGSRDVIGRIEVEGVPGFDEATSRDKGLIRTGEVEQLIDCVVDRCIRRLERYVVDITWKDRLDKDQSDTSRMRFDENIARITALVSRLADTEGIELVSYNPELVRIINEKSESFEGSIKALQILAEKTGDGALSARIDETLKKISQLQKAEVDARKAQRRAEARATAAERIASTATAKYEKERERSEFLMAASSLDQDTILNLHHQIFMYASDVHIAIKNMMGKIRRTTVIPKVDWIDFLGQASFRNSQIMTASRFATKKGYRQQATYVEADLVVYIRDYVANISSLWGPRGIQMEVKGDGKRFRCRFRPIEIGILIDNLISNAVKAKATAILFLCQVASGVTSELIIIVADNGSGWPETLEPNLVFDKGATTTDGSGLGLFHVKQIVEGMGGFVEACREPYSSELSGAQLFLRIPT